MKCIVVTPEKTEVDCEATFVALPLFDGEYGVAPLHTPMVGRLGAGELRVKKTDETLDRYYVEGGFVEVNGDVVSILTSRCLPGGHLDLDQAERLLQEASAMPASNRESFAAKENALVTARARLRTAKKWGGR